MTNTQIAKLYVAVNGKAPTAAELTTLSADTNAATTIMAMVSFVGADNTATLNAAYQAAFGRDADAEGLAYWSAELTAGTTTAANLMNALLEGAAAYPTTGALAATAAADVALTTNKATVALEIAAGALTTTQAATALALVTATDTTAASANVTAAIATNTEANDIVTVGQYYTLKTTIDTITGTTGNDTIIGDVAATGSTTSVADQIAAGAGMDTFKLYSSNGAVVIPVMSSVENFYIKSATAAVNIAAEADITSLELDAYTQAGGTDITVAAGQALTVSNTATAGAAVNIAGAASITSLDITTKASGSTAAINYDIDATGVKTVNLTSSGNGTAAQNNTITVTETGANLTAVTVAGSQAATVSVAASVATLTSFDASAATGNLTVTIGNSATATGAVSIKGGAGNDTITATGAVNYTMDLGAGNDRLITADAAGELTTLDSIDGGAGTDTIEMVLAEAIKLDANDAANNAILAKLTNFETLAITDAVTAAGALNVGALGFNNVTLVSDTITADATVSGFTSGATITNEALTMAGNTLTIVDGNGAATTVTAVVNNNTYTFTDVGEDSATNNAVGLAAAINAGEGAGTVTSALGVITGVTGYISSATISAGTSATVVTDDDVETVVVMTGATAAGTNDDTLNIALNGNLTAGTVLQSGYGVAGINKLNIIANDSNNTDGATNKGDGYAVELISDNSVDTITVTGSSFVHYTESATATSMSTIDASASTGDLFVSSAAHAGTQGVVIKGSAGLNTLTGSNLADNITGGALADTITGGTAGDTMTGGAGNDIFVIAAADAAVAATGTGNDTITDFSGLDVLRFAAADNVAGAGGTAVDTLTASVTAGGKATFGAGDDTLAEKIATLVVDAAIAANEVVFFELGSDTYVYGAGAAGNGTNDYLVQLTGVTGLTTMAESTVTAGDFTIA